MSAFKGTVYWKDQCDFCKGNTLCTYRRSVVLLMARLRVIELETQGCYGSLSFWCDYYQENPEAIEKQAKESGEVTCNLIEDGDSLHCSNCGGAAEKQSWAYWRYCPNCGAKVVS